MAVPAFLYCARARCVPIIVLRSFLTLCLPSRYIAAAAVPATTAVATIYYVSHLSPRKGLKTRKQQINRRDITKRHNPNLQIVMCYERSSPTRTASSIPR